MSQRMNQLTIAGDSQLITNSDIILSMMGLIAQGTCAYEDVDAYKEDPSFSYLLQHHKTPSKERLRQRMDKLGRYEKSQTILHESSIESIQQFGLIPTMKSVILKKKGWKKQDNSCFIGASLSNGSFRYRCLSIR